MLDPTIIVQLIEAVYTAATSPDLWADTLGLVCNVLDSSAAVLFATGGKTQDLLFAQTVGLGHAGFAMKA